jgi:hypothetical protein
VDKVDTLSASAAKQNDFAQARKLAAKNEALNNEATRIARELGAEACVDPD